MLAVAVHGEAAMDFAPLGAGGPEEGVRGGESIRPGEVVLIQCQELKKG